LVPIANSNGQCIHLTYSKEDHTFNPQSCQTNDLKFATFHISMQHYINRWISSAIIYIHTCYPVKDMAVLLLFYISVTLYTSSTMRITHTQGFQSGPVPGTFTRLRSCIVPVEITEPPKISGGQNHKYDGR
jgi:hypothetical protein